MNPREFEKKMRAGEVFHTLRVMPGAWIVLRVDGRSFSQFTADRYEKPFDFEFHQAMTATAIALCEEMQGVIAFFESDEISVLLPSSTDFFGREVEKLVSVSAGVASAAFSLEVGVAAHFDSRIWTGVDLGQVVDYFQWRQADATRCCLNGWVYWTMRKEGMGAEEATALSEGKSKQWKNDYLFERGINFNDLPVWQKRGVCIVREEYESEGFDPVAGKSMTTLRKRLTVDREIPFGEEFSEYVRRVASN